MKKIVFVTGTRADYGKLKPLIRGILNESKGIEVYLYVSGMHLLKMCGQTYKEILADGHKNIFLQKKIPDSKFMDENLAVTIGEFSKYVRKINPDLIIVHGDRIDALAGATVAMLNNVSLGHIEGGEVSGTVDESIRHAISKMSNLHFVSNEESKIRLMQLGENEEYIFVIGSPDIDVMLSDNLPSFEEAMHKLNLDLDDYGILIYHPVTTEVEQLVVDIKRIMDSLEKTSKNFIVIHPNNDLGSEIILEEYKKHKYKNKFWFFESVNFEVFLTLLKNSKFIIGNSSAGIREACIYGIPAIDIGTRQKNRYSCAILPNIISISANESDILKAIANIEDFSIVSQYFGDGTSTQKFINILNRDEIWNLKTQKQFKDTKDTKEAINLYHNEVCF